MQEIILLAITTGVILSCEYMIKDVIRTFKESFADETEV